ncbi:uncharacterized protein LOC112463501 [Temnothorax curvispinosus]|uniref:Uncharacterized protein LOC112463501 n=1 Tax=Temnothorax curvispinosus TaxID=300111 RepID=A0A6J1QT93_9HYME|nr:uncharacterized protein LOC112463501 [Temnothorax curvispinosus]XP_024885693.1 uncharacterized protein LOC112463501 [Temnothorax curvispinosus]
MASTEPAPTLRKRARMGTPRPRGPQLEAETEIQRAGPSAPQLSAEAEIVRAMLQEMRQIREEHAAAALMRQRDTEPQRQERSQLSPSVNRAHADSGSRVAVVNCGGEDPRRETEWGQNIKLKPDTYDGTIPLREFFSQFELIARANGWSDASKTIILASCLRGKARSILENVQDLENLDYVELKSKLELRFGEGLHSQNYYLLFTNRKQKFGEDLAELGSDLERLARLAYPECPFPVRDKIACSQFISALSNGFIRRTFQLEGVTSLKFAIERAKVVKIIQGDSFEKRKKLYNNIFERKNGKDARKENNEEKEGEMKIVGKGNRRGGQFGAGQKKRMLDLWENGAFPV